MLLDCYGPHRSRRCRCCRGRRLCRRLAVHGSPLALPQAPAGISRRLAIPKHRIIQLQRGPAEVERRNEQPYRHALSALGSIDDERSILPAWRKQGWLDQHIVAIVEIHGRPWLQVAVTNGSERALGELRRRGATVDNLAVPTRFHAQVLAHTVMVRQQAWRVHPTAQRLAAGRTQVWMADAPPLDLSALADDLGSGSATTDDLPR